MSHEFVSLSREKRNICGFKDCGLPITDPVHQRSLFNEIPDASPTHRDRGRRIGRRDNLSTPGRVLSHGNLSGSQRELTGGDKAGRQEVCLPVSWGARKVYVLELDEYPEQVFLSYMEAERFRAKAAKDGRYYLITIYAPLPQENPQ